MMRRSLDEVVVVVVVVAVMVMGGACGERVYVGGKQRWSQGVNYTAWTASLQQTIYVGYWLEFDYDKNYFDVLEVNETSYLNCNSDQFIANITQGVGRDVYQLKEARPYYFICSKGYCFSGMKVAINVEKKPPPPTPSPKPNAAAAGPTVFTGCMSFTPVLIVSISVLAMLVKV